MQFRFLFLFFIIFPGFILAEILSPGDLWTEVMGRDDYPTHSKRYQISNHPIQYSADSTSLQFQGSTPTLNKCRNRGVFGLFFQNLLDGDFIIQSSLVYQPPELDSIREIVATGPAVYASTDDGSPVFHVGLETFNLPGKPRINRLRVYGQFLPDSLNVLGPCPGDKCPSPPTYDCIAFNCEEHHFDTTLIDLGEEVPNEPLHFWLGFVGGRFFAMTSVGKGPIWWEEITDGYGGIPDPVTLKNSEYPAPLPGILFSGWAETEQEFHEISLTYNNTVIYTEEHARNLLANLTSHSSGQSSSIQNPTQENHHPPAKRNWFTFPKLENQDVMGRSWYYID